MEKARLCVWEVEYILRFGNYISGEGKAHIWRYMANDDGSITFMKEEGDEVPSWMRCERPPVDVLIGSKI